MFKCNTLIIDTMKMIRCTLEGEPDIQESLALSLSLRKKASELGYNVLYDARKVQLPSSIFPTYNLAIQVASMIDGQALRAVRVSFLCDTDRFDDHWKFWETASLNRGLQLKCFTDESSAMDWLSC